MRTCDHRIHWVCKANEIKTINTSEDHVCGTDRLNEACEHLGFDDQSIIVNVQGDEPFVEPQWINEVAVFMEKNVDHSSCIPWQYLNEYNDKK